MATFLENKLTPFERQSIAIARRTLDSGPYWDWLKSRDLVYNSDWGMAVHTNPRGLEYKCLMLDELRSNPSAAALVFSLFNKVLFVGDNHQSWVFTDDNRGFTDRELNYEYDLSRSCKTIVSVGATGQPRDGDPRASYVVASPDLIIWRRVQYDVVRTVQKMQSLAGTTSPFAMRLLDGV